MLTRRDLLVPIIATVLAPAAALAHHGWGWTEGAVFVLEGTIEEIFLGNPHAMLKVRAADGVWEVDLAPPIRTRRAGFDEEAAAVGDAVVVRGHRSSNPGDRHMKAIRVEVRGKTYDVYPDRVHEL
ncbi:DUF6152 family protein [Faunimonas sp. B44]|uniref:DUF6152 family protein n=1 Tax=Faunimonas sp. B44 TaxID=3461493 RepID=UPI0040443558